MPWWLIYYVGNVFEIKTFIGYLCFFFAVEGLIQITKNRKFSVLVISFFLFALLMLLPDGNTAINIYNSVN